jgi:hypothetical protein
MSDLNIIYDCLFNKTYQNKVLFEIELGKVDDKELVVGFLFNLTLNSIAYESDKDLMLSTWGSLGLKPEQFDIKKCYKNFLDLIQKVNSENLSENSYIRDALMAVISKENFEEVVNKCKNKNYLLRLKNILLESEEYELISIVDKKISKYE